MIITDYWLPVLLTRT